MPGKEKTDGPEQVSSVKQMEHIMLGAASTHPRAASPYLHFEAPQPGPAIDCATPLAPAPEADGEIASKVLEHLDMELFVLNATAAIVYCNEAARRLLTQKADIFSRRGELCFANCEKNRWLRSQLSALHQSGERAAASLVPGEDPREHRLLSVGLLCSGALGLRFVVTLSPLSRAPADERIRQLMQHFGLTPAEQRLTLFLSTGRHLVDAARTFRLSRHTVRNQLRSVYDKAGVTSQSELALLMCAAPREGDS